MITDMTKGSISRHLIGFSIPLILGNLFQLTYNAVDSVILGRFAGEQALAAVGTANPVMNLMILGISGICIGASVLMSGFFGAGQYGQLKKEISTTLVSGCLFSLALMMAGFLFSRTMLQALSVPPEILDASAQYLRIIFLGMPFTFFYNAVAAALRSVGDSKTPVKFLAFASVLNGCLDLLFVAALGLGVVGAGAATVIAESVSALLCVAYVYRKVPLISLKRSEFHIDGSLLRLTLKHGSITALQQACQPVGKLLIQSTVNSLGISVIAAFNAVSRVDDFAFTPEQSISNGMMTFIAQNRGAKEKGRVQQGFRTGLFLEFGYWILICVAILVIKEPLMRLFAMDGQDNIVSLGVEYLTLMAFFYLLPAITNGIQGYFRGMGQMHVTLVCTLVQISVRVLFVFLLMPSIGIRGAAYACLAGWVLMLLAEVPYYFWFKKRILDPPSV